MATITTIVNRPAYFSSSTRGRRSPSPWSTAAFFEAVSGASIGLPPKSGTHLYPRAQAGKRSGRARSRRRAVRRNGLSGEPSRQICRFKGEGSGMRTERPVDDAVLKPISEDGTARMYRLANVLKMSRRSGQLTTLTPLRYRDPMTTS